MRRAPYVAIEGRYLLARGAYETRRARKLSRRALARAARMSHHTIARIEAGDVGAVRLSTVAKLAAALGCENVADLWWPPRTVAYTSGSTWSTTHVLVSGAGSP